MSKYNLNEGNESLKKILLLMKYDNRKTLTENVELIEKNNSIVESSVNEQAGQRVRSAIYNAGVGAGTGAVIGSIVPGLGTTVPTVVGALYGIMKGSGTSYNKIKESINQYCIPEYTGESTMSKQDLNGIADSIFDAVDGMGTKEDKIKSALQGLSVFPDLCELSKVYLKRHGETLIDALGDDISEESEWKKYVWLPILDLIDNTPEAKDNDEVIVPTPEDDNEEIETESKYKKCTGTYKMYCYNKEVIGKVQTGLGVKSDGAYGPITQAALEKAGYKNGFTDADVSKIVKGGGSEDVSPNVVIKKDSDKDYNETVMANTNNQDTVAGILNGQSDSFN